MIILIKGTGSTGRTEMSILIKDKNNLRHFFRNIAGFFFIYSRCNLQASLKHNVSESIDFYLKRMVTPLNRPKSYAIFIKLYFH